MQYYNYCEVELQLELAVSGRAEVATLDSHLPPTVYHSLTALLCSGQVMTTITQETPP